MSSETKKYLLNIKGGTICYRLRHFLKWLSNKQNHRKGGANQQYVQKSFLKWFLIPPQSLYYLDTVLENFSRKMAAVSRPFIVNAREAYVQPITKQAKVIYVYCNIAVLIRFLV